MILNVPYGGVERLPDALQIGTAVGRAGRAERIGSGGLPFWLPGLLLGLGRLRRLTGGERSGQYDRDCPQRRRRLGYDR